jgi:hypothetical protein
VGAEPERKASHVKLIANNSAAPAAQTGEANERVANAAGGNAAKSSEQYGSSSPDGDMNYLDIPAFLRRQAD